MKNIVCIVLILVTVSFSGCYGKYELNEIGIVSLVGVDIDDTNNIILSVICILPAQQNSDVSNYWLGISEGSSIMEASKNMNSMAMKKLLWFENDIIIVGERFARNGVRDLLDFIGRNRENRLSNKILVVDGKANELLQIPSDVSIDLPSEIKGIAKNSKQWSKTYTADIREFLISAANPNVGSYTGKISMKETKRNTFSTNRESFKKMSLEGQDTNIAYVEGVAIFKKDKLIGWLNGKETRGLLFITNKIKTGSISAESDEFSKFSVDIVSSKAKISPKLEGNTIEMSIDIDTKCRIVEISKLYSTNSKDTFLRIEGLVSDLIKEEVTNTMKLAQKEYGVDIFNFSNIILNKYPDYWREIESEWEKIYQSMNINYRINVTVSGFGLISDSIVGED